MAIIIVEDDIAVADSLDALLRSEGHEARVFRSAEDLFEAGPPGADDTVVVDLGLPGITGAGLLAWLRALAAPPRLVVISGKSSTLIAREIGRTSGLQVLRKPPSDDWLKFIAG